MGEPNEAHGRIRGVAIREFLAFLRAELGPTEMARILRSMPRAQRGAFDAYQTHLGVVSERWYDAASVHALLDALAATRPERERKRLTEAGVRCALGHTLTGIHRTLIRAVATPELHARFAQRVWDAYYEDGVVRSERAGSEQHIAFFDWGGHHPILCEMTMTADTVLFPMMGLQRVRVKRTRCISRGDSHCAHIVRWT